MAIRAKHATQFVMSSLGDERTASDVHSTLCALVTTQAATSSAWSEYASVLLDAETETFFAARLAQGVSGGDDSSQPSKKKRKLRDDDDGSGPDEKGAAVAVICEHCGGAVPEVSLRVACLDGSSLEVTVAQRGLVREVKRLVGQVRSASCACSDDNLIGSHWCPCLQSHDLDPGLLDLFVDGKENALPDLGRLDGLGLGSGSVLFMLQRLGWRWDMCGDGIVHSADGLVATMERFSTGRLLTGGAPLTEGRHYWELELTRAIQPCQLFVGAVRPGLDHNKTHAFTNDAYFIYGNSGSLYGNGKNYADRQGSFKKRDRIGVLLDLDAGWMRFYRNGVRCGPGFTEGVTGPLVRAAELLNSDGTLTVLLGAVAPEGAGATDEPWPEPEPQSEPASESEVDY
jgi:hypothetical protein